MIKEHDLVALLVDVPSENLASGDVGTVVHVHQGGKAFEVEFTTVLGRTIVVATIPNDQLRAVSERDVAHARRVE